MSDDEDYMSDKYLAQDHKPGLMPKMFLEKHQSKEKAQRKDTEKTKPAKTLQAESREAKLNQSLDESNKGFAMLSKMGFKKGMGLGKQGQGRSEPIPLEIREGRKGLGKEAVEKQKKRDMVRTYVERAKRRKEEEETLRGEFKSRVRGRQSERQNASDLYKSQKACQQLDEQKGLQPLNEWAWPKVKQPEEEEVEEEEEDPIEPEVAEQLEILTEYLRTTHLYCIWCGTKYEDTNDLKEHCPGNDFEAHNDT